MDSTGIRREENVCILRLSIRNALPVEQHIP